MATAVLDVLTSPLKMAVTSALQGLLSQYIKDIELQGMGIMDDIVLNNLELRLDVLQLRAFLHYFVIPN